MTLLKARAFLRAARQQRRQHQDDASGGQIEQPVRRRLAGVRRPGEKGVGQFGREVDAEALQNLVEITGPADGDRRGAGAIFEHQIPADDPGENLAERRISISVSAARHGNQRGEFGVAQSDKGAGDSRQKERNHHPRPRDIGGDRAGEHENAGADDPADSERQQRRPAQRALQSMTLGVIGGDDGFDGFAGEVDGLTGDVNARR